MSLTRSVGALLGLLAIAGCLQAAASPVGVVVFTFDDSDRSQLVAAKALDEHGWRGTFYVISGELRELDLHAEKMSATEIVALAKAGHDVEAHTVHHVALTEVPAEEALREMVDGQAALAALTGSTPRHLAYPFSSENPFVQNLTLQVYDTGRIAIDDRGAQRAMVIFDPTLVSRSAIPAVVPTRNTTLERAQSYVDEAAASGGTVVFAFHGIDSRAGLYDWAESDLRALLDHVEKRGVQVVTIEQLFEGLSAR